MNAPEIDQTDSAQNHPLQIAARKVRDVMPPNTGFIIISCPFGDGGTERGDYISNVSRDSAIAILKTVLFRWGINDEWMRDAK